MITATAKFHSDVSVRESWTVDVWVMATNIRSNTCRYWQITKTDFPFHGGIKSELTELHQEWTHANTERYLLHCLCPAQ